MVPINLAYVANVMDGRAHGVELTLERRSGSGLTGWASYAWGDAQNTDTGVRALLRVPAETFPADWDQRHTLNLNLGYRWSERSSVSARYRLGSNFPLQGYYQALDGGRHVLTSERNAGRLPAYSRLDIRADRTFTYRTRRLTLFAEVINVLNRSNYRAQGPGLDRRTGEVFGLVEELFPLLPSAGVLIEF